MKAIYAGLIIGCVLAITEIFTVSVGAMAHWEVEKSVSTSFSTTAFCPTYRRSENIKSYLEPQLMCVLGADELGVGSFLRTEANREWRCDFVSILIFDRSKGSVGGGRGVYIALNKTGLLVYRPEL